MRRAITKLVSNHERCLVGISIDCSIKQKYKKKAVCVSNAIGGLTSTTRSY